MYIAVCDDQETELERIANLLDIWKQEHQAVLRYKTFRSAAELLNAAEKEEFTLYLLDVMMPMIDGIAAAREIRSFDDTAEIIFLTSSPDFAYASYSVRALNYLLKPIQAELLFNILNSLCLREQKHSDNLMLKAGTRLIRVPFQRLIYVEVIDKHLYFHLTDGTVHEIVGSLKTYQSLLLSHPEFRQVHRSYIVNLMQVAEISSTTIKTDSGQSIPVSRRIYPELQKDYIRLLFSREEPL